MILKSLSFSFLWQFVFFCRKRFHFNPNPLPRGLFLCCGQFVSKKQGPRHSKCPGQNSGYQIGGLFLELEYCPHNRCNGKFADPQANILHQEQVHRSVLTWFCSICEISFASEGCSVCHILSYHNGPAGYAQDLDKYYEGCKPPTFTF